MISKLFDFINKIKQFLNIRYVSPPKAMYRLLKYPLNDILHVLYRLAVHLEKKNNMFILKKVQNTN